MNKSKIDWCDYTWNPVTGCLHGCTYCYAKRIAERFGNFPCESGNCAVCGDCTLEPSYNCKNYIPIERVHELDNPIYSFNPKRIQPYPYGFEPTFHKYHLEEPKQKTKGKNIFVCSMADLFGDWVPESWINQIFNICKEAPQHRYIFLTKNPKRYGEFISQWKSYSNSLKNMWFGTTVTGNGDTQKAFDLLNNTTKDVNKFLSIEPLLKEIDLDEKELLLSNYKNIAAIGNYIDWIIVGGQTGPKSVVPEIEWIQKIIHQCKKSGVPVFLKDNLKWHERIKEFPW